MSNIHALEPQAYGLIKFQTTFGDIDIELFTKQCPKITRNFVKLCLQKFYDKAKLYKLEKDFIAIVGEFNSRIDDSSNLPDEFHSRLRFTRRGLIATANTKKDANGPEFFFTLGPTQELQGKHTIFGRVKGGSLYNLVDLNDCPVDSDLKPKGDKLVNSVTVVENPFPDLEDAHQKSTIESQSSLEEEEEEESSSDDEDSNTLVLDRNKKLSFFPGEDDDEEDEDEEDEQAKTPSVKTVPNTISFQDTGNPNTKPDSISVGEASHHAKHMNLNKEDRLREIRAQIQSIRDQLVNGNNTRSLDQRRIDAELSEEEEFCISKKDSNLSTNNKRHREQETIELLETFKKKLKHMQTDQIGSSKQQKNDLDSEKIDDTGTLDDELAALDQVDSDEWLLHRFDADKKFLKNDSSIRQVNPCLKREEHQRHRKCSR